MTIKVLAALVFFGVLSLPSAWALGVVPGSCSPTGSGPGLCSCELTTDDPGVQVYDNAINCSDLTCADFAPGWQQGQDCGQSANEVCRLRNEEYAGDCLQNVTYLASSSSSGLDACQQVINYLNDPYSSGQDYCSDTPIRGGWQLIWPGLGFRSSR